jgi:glycosyltransferase involved in cell wall biosynthesis
MKKILCINAGGAGNLHGLRMRALTKELQADVIYYDVDRDKSRLSGMVAIWKLLNSQKWDLVYQESTGISVGIPLILASILHHQNFIVSSGDPVGGFFHVTKGPLWGSIFGTYERLLYRSCTAFVGWTPYLAGAALKFGAKRAVTIEGAVDLEVFQPQSSQTRVLTRQNYGIPQDHIVCGVVGSLQWSDRQKYSYGYELIETLKHLQREDLSVLIVGDGDARTRLEAAIPDRLKHRVIFTGRLPQEKVVSAMNIMNIGFVTQTLDELGSYRLTTKLPEYFACGLPVAMSPIPGFYDYCAPAGWPLPPHHPASQQFHIQCAHWLDSLTEAEILAKATQAPMLAQKYFDYVTISNKFCNFVESLLDITHLTSEKSSLSDDLLTIR